MALFSTFFLSNIDSSLLFNYRLPTLNIPYCNFYIHVFLIDNAKLITYYYYQSLDVFCKKKF